MTSSKGTIISRILDAVNFLTQEAERNKIPTVALILRECAMELEVYRRSSKPSPTIRNLPPNNG